MSNIFYFLTVLFVMAFVCTAYFAGYVHGKNSKDNPFEIKSVIKKKKPPDPDAEAKRKELERQLYNIEHYNGSPDGMKRKGGT